MSQEKTEALVLRGVDFSETSRILTLLTPDRGRISVIAKGARRRNSPVAAILDAFNRAEIVYFYKEGREVHTLAEVSLLESWAALKGDLAANAFGSFCLELTGRICHENEPNRPVFETLVQGLRVINARPANAPTTAAWLALHLLSAGGFAPAIDHCAACGGVPGAGAGFSWAGGVVCGRCHADRALAPELLSAFQAAAAQEPPAADGPPALFGLVRRYAARQLEADFRSVRVLEQLFDEV